MSGNNGEKEKRKSPPEFKEEYKDAFIYVALKMIEKLSGQGAQICIKQEALDSFPEKEAPIFVWDNRKEHWAVINPIVKPETKKNIVTPKRGLILPP